MPDPKDTQQQKVEKRPDSEMPKKPTPAIDTTGKPGSVVAPTQHEPERKEPGKKSA
jgi:hypothetical protein